MRRTDSSLDKHRGYNSVQEPRASDEFRPGTDDVRMGDFAPEPIQRVLYITPKVHVYGIPPMTSRGYMASEWTVRDPIFTARLRILETATPHSSTPAGETVAVTIQLEDPSSGELFAAAPYTHASTVTHCADSSRFFAVRVVGDGGRKATLGLGFEERSDAFDFGVTLQDAAKILGLAGAAAAGARATSKGKTEEKAEPPKDYSLKEGETIVVHIGSKGGEAGCSRVVVSRPLRTATRFVLGSAAQRRGRAAGFGAERGPAAAGPTAAEMGFDDGEFGEFQ